MIAKVEPSFSSFTLGLRDGGMIGREFFVHARKE
jgi:hypothetical protein